MHAHVLGILFEKNIICRNILRFWVVLFSYKNDFFFFASARNLMGLAICNYLSSISGTETFSIAQMTVVGTRAG